MRSPFKLLDSYNPEDKDIFFGREKEIETLYNMVYKTPLVMVYGLSGTGKTSLVQCGLANQFDGPDWLPFLIRKEENINTSLRSALNSALGSEEPVEDLKELVEALFYKYFRPVYLIIDQFEELFILGNEQEQLRFMQDIQSLQESELPCRVVLILREEYIGQLYEFEKIVPTLFDFKMRVEPMTNKHIREVILQSFAAFNIKLEPPEDHRCEQIIQKLSSGKSNISLPFLQVYLDMFYRVDYKRSYPDGTEEKLPPLEFTEKEINEFGEIDDVLERFLSEKTQEIQTSLTEKDNALPQQAVKLVLDVFVTEEGTKRPIPYTRTDQQIQIEKSAEEQLSLLSSQALSQCLLELEEARLLRFRKDTIELAHDTLAALIDQQRTDEQRALNEMRREIRSSYGVHQQTGDFLTLGQLELYRPNLQKLGLDDRYLKFISQSQKHHKDLARIKEEELEQERQLREKAQRNEDRARKQSRNARIGLASALLLAIIAVIAFFQANKNAGIAEKQKKNKEKIIEAIYFYKDSLALASSIENGSVEYGFINKEGKVIIDYQYDEATSFDGLTGFARVSKYGKKYFLDPEGTEYELAYNIEDLTPEITALNLSNGNLSQIPKSVFQNPQLKILILSGNALRSLPSEFGKLVKLKHLDLSGNMLGSLPPEIGNLVNLEFLDLSDMLDAVDPDQWDSWIRTLKSLPPDIGNLEKLKYLDLSHNGLDSLPTEIGNLVNLESLFLRQTFLKLESLIPEIGNLVNLKHLVLVDDFQGSSREEIEKLLPHFEPVFVPYDLED